METEDRIQKFRVAFTQISQEIEKVIVGHKDVIEGTLFSIMAGGHVLLEGVPGLGKTLLIRTLSQVMGLPFNRIQFTPDLMPADILGTNIVVDNPDGGRSFEFQKGPIFSNILLADEINRTTPKTQSAMLEAMQEKNVTAGGQIRKLDAPFFVLATQNPIDQEGTYPLPEAQLDRFFFKLVVAYPSRDEMNEVISRTTEPQRIELLKIGGKQTIIEMQKLVVEVPISTQVKDYAVRIVMATHPQSEFSSPMANQFLKFGSSPRGAQTLILAAKVRALVMGRFNVSFEDIQAVAKPALRHRMILNFEAEAEDINPDIIIDEILKTTPKASESPAPVSNQN